MAIRRTQRNWARPRRKEDGTKGAAEPRRPTTLTKMPKIAIHRPKKLLAMGTHHRIYPMGPMAKLRKVWRGRA
jgi:hypothetical protein